MSADSFERVHSASSPAAIVFVCDHAANALPPAYGTLGLRAYALKTHIAYDIGAAEVTRVLAAAYAAPAILARWSRLLIDLNRGPDDPTLIMKLSDGRIIPGNRHIGPEETQRRVALFHAPYHSAVEAELAQSHAAGVVPLLVSMHSFTPVWKGLQRPWEVGVLWDKDARLARPLIAALLRAGFRVGDNEPYSGELENDCLFVHGTMNGFPHVLIEIRQDLIGTDAQARTFAARLKPILDRAIAAMEPPEIRYTRLPSAALRERQVSAGAQKTHSQDRCAALRRGRPAS